MARRVCQCSPVDQKKKCSLYSTHNYVLTPIKMSLWFHLLFVLCDLYITLQKLARRHQDRDLWKRHQTGPR